MLTVQPRVAEFSKEDIPLDEIVAFYSIDKVKVPDDRPYIWTNTVASVDGVISLLEPGQTEAKEIAMAHLQNSGSGSDWKLLNSGWMFADAVITSSRETELICKIHHTDLLEYRKNVLKKERDMPLQVIITKEGQTDFSTNTYAEKRVEKLIVTTEAGYYNLLNHGRKFIMAPTMGDREVMLELKERVNVRAKVMPQSNSSGIDVLELCKYLRKENIRYVDVSAGAIVISQFIQKKLLDESRITKSGQLFGHYNTKGEPRPLAFDRYLNFGSANAPLFHYLGIRLFGYHHIFVRGVWEYRH